MNINYIQNAGNRILVEYGNGTHQTLNKTDMIWEDISMIEGDTHYDIYRKFLDVYGYTLFTDNRKLSLTNNDISNEHLPLSLTIDLIEPVSITEISYDLTTSALPITKIEYSADSFTFYEHEYTTYIIKDITDSYYDDKPELLETIRKYEGYIFHRTPISRLDLNIKKVSGVYGIYNKLNEFVPIDENCCITFVDTSAGVVITDIMYTMYDIDTKIPLWISDTESALLKPFLETNRGNNEFIYINYVFKYYDKYELSDMVLSTGLVKTIKLVFDNISLPFTINYIKCFGDISIDINKTDLTYIVSTLFRQKYFQDYPFIQSICNSYFEMLVEKGI